jgi:hypothetical protein
MRVLFLLLVLPYSAKTQILVGLQLQGGYNHTKLANSFDDTNKRGMRFIPSYYQQYGVGLSLAFTSNLFFEVNANTHRVEQKYKFARPSPVVPAIDLPSLVIEAQSHLLFNGLNFTCSKRFGSYDQKIRAVAGAGVSYNTLFSYADVSALSTKAGNVPSSQSAYLYESFDRGYYTRDLGNGPESMQLNTWLYKKQDVRALLNLGAQAQLQTHVFLLLNLQAQFGLGNIETTDSLTATRATGTLIKVKNLQQRFDCKYETGAPYQGPLRNKPTKTMLAGIFVGLRFQFGRYD